MQVKTNSGVIRLTNREVNILAESKDIVETINLNLKMTLTLEQILQKLGDGGNEIKRE